MRCVGAAAATQAAIDVSIITGDGSSEPAREGTAAHELGEKALQYADCNPVRRAEFWIDETITVKYKENGEPKSQDFVIDQDMADFVQVYVDQVMREPGELLIEQVVDLTPVYGVEAKGTADAIVLDHENDRLYVGDLKFGRGVMVHAKDNWQLYSYAAGALVEYDLMGDWKTITVAIHQPRLHHYDEHTLTRDELEAFMADAQKSALEAQTLVGADVELIETAKTAGESQCQWCPLKGSCRTLATYVHDTVFDDFTALGDDCKVPKESAELSDLELGKFVARADLIASTVSHWRAEAHKRVSAGIDVPGWKMVEGKRGPRKWGSDEAAKKVMKGARMKDTEMYSMKLLTAPAAEKVIAKKKPKVWTRLKALIIQADGKPSLAPESDPRPAMKIADSESFQDTTTDDMSDLL